MLTENQKGETAMRTTLALVLLATLAGPVLAGTWTAPQGCEIFLTVQSKACLLYTSDAAD